MPRVRCRDERGLVAGIAVLGRSLENIVDMALRTGCSHMCTSERESRLGMVEGGGNPAFCRMADGAVGRETGSNVIRFHCRGEIRLVAGIAILWSSRIASIHVALAASHGAVHAG